MRTIGLSDPTFNEPAGGYRKALLEVLGLNVTFSHAEGDYLYLGDRAIYDGSAQYGTNIFGHNDPGVVAALTSHLQAAKCNFVQPFRNRSQDDLANRLVEATRPMKHCVFANSGAEAVEASIKLARLATRRRKIVTLKGGFHGKTELALSVSGSDRHTHPLICERDEATIIRAGDLVGLEELLAKRKAAAFLFEPVLGEGGMFAPDRDWCRAAIALCQKYGTLVIADEIQCGLYRCGSFLLSHGLDYDVDIALLGKGLGGGLMPISAILMKGHVRTREFDRKHSSTFAGGGLACAVADNVVQRLTSEETLADRISHLSARIDKRAQALGNRVRVTGIGLMRGIYFPGIEATGNIGLTFLVNSGLLSNLISAYLFRKHDIISLPLISQSCALRLEPALNTTVEAIDKFFDGIDDVAHLIAQGRYDILLAEFLGRPESSLPHRDIAFPVYNNDDDRCLPLVPLDGGSKFDFAFLSHLTQPSDVDGLLPRSVRENMTKQEIEQITALVARLGQIDPSPAVLLSFEVDGPLASRQGLILSSLLFPRDLMRLPARERDFLIDAYFHKARSLGAEVVGLGAYTSVITGGGKIAAKRFPDMCVTTGNTLTAAATAAELQNLSRRRPVVVAVIGARGSIGSLVTLAAAQYARRLILIGRATSSPVRYQPLLKSICREMLSISNPAPESVAARIQSLLGPRPNDSDLESAIAQLCAEGADGPTIVVTGDYDKFLNQADFVVSCSSEGKPFLTTDHLKNDAVVLDTARPFDFASAPDKPGPEIMESGLVKQPTDRRYGDNNLLSEETGVALGCFSETVALSMDNRRESFMIAEKPSLAMLQEIEALALRHGFRLPEQNVDRSAGMQRETATR